jgi:hypothetical protein
MPVSDCRSTIAKFRKSVQEGLGAPPRLQINEMPESLLTTAASRGFLGLWQHSGQDAFAVGKAGID